MHQIGILITGNEILYGKTRDTNGFFISAHLRKQGISIASQLTCADNENDILSALHFLAQKADTIFMTGGLGPTNDDLTAHIVAQFLNIPLQFSEQAWKHCVDIYTRLGRGTVPESNKKQAFLPAGCQLLPNPMGTALGFSVSKEIDHKKTTLFCMPGVPFEMEPMFLNFVLPQLQNKNKAPIVKTWQVFFMGESAMQTAIQNAEKKLLSTFPDGQISYQAHPSYVTYTVTLFADSLEKRTLCEAYLSTQFSPLVDSAFGECVLYDEDTPLWTYAENLFKEKELSFFFCKGLDFFYNPKQNLNKEEHIRLLCKNSMELMKLDIALAAMRLSSNECLLVLTVRKNSDENLSRLEKKLALFAWKLHSVEKGTVVFTCRMNLNPQQVASVQHMRIEVYGMCSVIAAADVLLSCRT